MDKRKFADIVAENFKEIQGNFRKGLPSKGYSYDEDIMNDAFISCCNALKDKELTKSEALKYYWTAYINKHKTHSSKIKHHIQIDEERDEEIGVIEETYDNTIDNIYDIIMKGVRDKFGVRDARIFELHTCQGLTSKEIQDMGFDHVENLMYFTRKIKRYIMNHIIPSNQKLQELIKHRKEA
jgi:hypothetical protein